MTEIPDDVKRFILLGVPSVPYLEAMLLFRSHGAPLPGAEVARRLYLPEGVAAELITQLAEARVILPAEGGQWRYSPDAALGEMIDRLAHAYAANLVGVAKLIHAKTDRRAAQFAEAFKIRKE